MKLKELSELIKISATELESAVDEYLAAKEKWQKIRTSHNALMVEYNQKSGNFDSMEWLIKNPTAEGQYEAISKKMKELYGGNYNGVHHSGYVHNGNHKPIQQAFDLHLTNYDGDVSHRKNIEHFLENFLCYFVPYMEISSRYDDTFPEVSVVGFQYKSEDSGLSYIGYDPEESAWYHFTMRFGTVNTDKKFKTLTEILDWIYE